MNINRNNYEEYFLLYADNELPVVEKNMVEIFLKENPDLEEDFLMLQQSIVKPDKSITLQDKDFLFRNSKQFINDRNYQEVFVLFNDNELSGAEKEETENFIKQDKGLQHALALLQRTKLEPDYSIVFPDKRILYKKENDGRVVPFKWWSAAAAAIILGFGLWFGVSYLQKDKTEQGVAVNKTKAGPTKETQDKPIVNSSQAQTNSSQNNEASNDFVEQKNGKSKPGLKVVPAKKQINKVAINDDQLVKNSKQLNKTPEKKPDLKITQETNNDLAVVTDNVGDKPIKQITNNLEKPIAKQPQQDNSMNSTPPNLYAQTVSYQAETNDNYVFYNVTTEEFNRSKVGGFLKKLKRNIIRRSPFNRNNEPEVTLQ